MLSDAGSLLSTSVFIGLQECPQMSCCSARVSVCAVILEERETHLHMLINVYFCIHLSVFSFDWNPKAQSTWACRCIQWRDVHWLIWERHDLTQAPDTIPTLCCYRYCSAILWSICMNFICAFFLQCADTPVMVRFAVNLYVSTCAIVNEHILFSLKYQLSQLEKNKKKNSNNTKPVKLVFQPG